MVLPILRMVLKMTSEMKYAVLIEAFEGEWDYVRVESNWNYATPIKTFDSKEDAEREAKKWNTGEVVQYDS